MYDRRALLQAEAAQHGVHALRPEDPHQVVFEAEIEFRGAGVALAAGTAAELIVDAAALVPLGRQHEQAAGGERGLLRLGDLGADLLRPAPVFGLVLHLGELLADQHVGVAAELDVGAAARSEEHTSELQSLMRISYAVFCLKKKKN